MLESTGYDIDPQSGSVVNPLGLHGYNCWHSHKPWDIRLRNPCVDENGNLKIDSEENRKRYELQQKQRAMERSIRSTKRKLIEKQEQINLVAETDVKEILQRDYDKLSFKWTQQNGAYNDFCKQNDLQPQYDRIKVADFNREQTKKANAGERQHADKQNELQNNVARRHTDSSKIVVQKGENGYNIPRSKEELQKAAQIIKSQIGNYAVNESKWSGNIFVDNSLTKNILGEKRWNCDIALIDTADDGIIWHEMLHSCSVSYYSFEIYSRNQYIEEASVEFLKQQICLERKIESAETYSSWVARLKILNDNFMYGTDMEFAKELFNVPLPERYQWLEDKVEQSLRDNNLSFVDFNDVLRFVQELKGGNDGQIQ